MPAVRIVQQLGHSCVALWTTARSADQTFQLPE
jgi:hypothetical protein